MNGLLGRTRRVLAGLVSAMMVLTSLPLTGVAAYAAPSENAAVDEAAVADVDEVAVADEADDAAVADEADEAAQPDGGPEELVTISFNRGGIYGVISVSVNETEYDFEAGKDTVSANVPVGVPLTFAFILSPIPSPGFYAFPTYNGSADRITRDSEDLNLFTFTPDSDGVINVGSVSQFEVSVDSSSITGSFTGTVKNSGKDYLNNPAEDIVFTLSNIPEEFISYTVKAAAGTQELAVSRTGNENEWKISANEAKKAVYAQAPIKITVEGITAAKQSVTFRANEDVTAITYGPTDGTGNTVSMADAKSASGATVSVNAGEDQKMKVTVSDEALLLSDSVTVDDRTVTKDEDDTYKISVNEAVAVDVKAYKKVLISVNNLMDTAGKKTFATIGVDTGMDDGDLTDGEAITFGYHYASEVSDYDVNLAAPEAYTRKGSDTTPITMIAPEGDEVTGEYTIKKEDVEAAIRDGAEIFIYARGEVLPKVKLAFTIPADGLISAVIYNEYSPSDKTYVKKEEAVNTAGWDSTSVNGIPVKKGEIEVREGNIVYLTAINCDSDLVGFYRAQRDSKDLKYGANGFPISNIKDGDTVNIVSAALKKNEISIAVTGNSEAVSYNLIVDPECVVDLGGEGYVTSSKSLSFMVENDDKDPVWQYKLDNIRYEINKGPSGEVWYDNYSNSWYLTLGQIEEAAFAKADDQGIKLRVTAKVVKTVTKPQKLTVISDPGSSDFDVLQGGTLVYSSGDGGAELKYGEAATVTVAPDAGYALDKVYLVKDEALKAAGLNTEDEDFGTKFRNKISQNQISATPFTPGKDGKAKVAIKKVDAPYTVIALNHPIYEVVVEDRDNRIPPDKNGVYVLEWYGGYDISAKKGENWLYISGNSISANNGEKDVTAQLLGDTSSDESYLTLYGSDDDVNGREITLSFTVKDTTPRREELKLRFTKKPGNDAVQFAEGVLSENKIIKPQPLGTTRTYDLTVEEGISLKASCEKTGVTASTVPVKNRAGKITGYKLTIASESRKTLIEGAATEIKLYDANSPWEMIVTVSFSADQVKNADLNGIKAEADSDTITLDFSGVTGIDRTTHCLYYYVTISTNSTPSVLKKSVDDSFPVGLEKTTIDLEKVNNNDEDVETDPVTYTVEVSLIQANYDGNHMISGLAESSDEVKTISVTTKPDAVFATKIKLQKVKPAATLYARGMFDVPVAKVVYPNVGGKAVTARKVKRAVLTDSEGNTEDASQWFSAYGEYIYFSGFAGIEPGKYTLTVYATEPKGREVKTSMKINVVMPIFDLDLKVPTDTLYKRPNKAASVKATVVYNDPANTGKKYQPKTKKVTWSLVDEDEKPLDLPAGISIKNGKVTVARNFVLPTNDIKFKIKAVAADFDHGDDPVVAYSTPITLQSITEAAAPAQLIVDDITVKPGAVVSSVITGKAAVADIEGNILDNVSITATGALKAGYYDPSEPDEISLSPCKFGKATVKVKTTDGSNLSKTFKYTIKGDEGFFGSIGHFEETGEDFDLGRSDYYLTNTDVAGQDYLAMIVTGKYSGAVDCKIKLSGLKKVAKIPALPVIPLGYYVLKPTARDATVTITDKKTKQKVTIYVTNEAFAPNNQKTAASITAANTVVTTVGKPPVNKKGTIYTNIGYGTMENYNKVSCNYVTYTVKYGKKAAKKDEKVRIDILGDDEMKNEDYSLLDAVLKASGGKSITGSHSYVMTLGEGGAFHVNYVSPSGGFDITPGTYKYQVTPLDVDGNPAYKSGIVKLKAVSVPKASVQAAKVVTFSGTKLKTGASANVVITKEINVAAACLETKLGAEGEDLDIRGINTRGRINDFAKMFRVEDGKLVYTGVKSPYYDAKKGISGVVAVSCTNLAGGRTMTYVPITVKGDFVDDTL